MSSPSSSQSSDQLTVLLQKLIDRRVDLEPIKVSLPTNTKAEEMMKWFDSLFAAVIGISTLGAGFTFSIIFSDVPVPLHQDGQSEQELKNHVRFLLSLSWLFFVAAIAQASAASLLFTFNRDWFLSGLQENLAWQNVIATLTSLGVQALPTGAFLVASWAISLYCPKVGWAAFGFIGCFGFLLQFVVFVKA